MSTIDRREFVRLLALTAVQPLVDNSSAKVSGADGSAPPASADGLSIVSRHKVVTTSPPGNIPTAVSSDALFLGNGDLISAFAGDPDLLQFWVTLNDFWEMREWGGPRALGRIVFELPDFQGATYRVEQDLATATLTGIFTSGLRTLTMTSWVAATENLLVVELTVEGGSTSGRVSFRFPDELGLGVTKNQNWDYSAGGNQHETHLPTQEKSWQSSVLRAERTFHIDTTQTTRAAMGARILGRAGEAFQIKPGDKIVFIAALSSWCKASRPLELACNRVAHFDADEIPALRASHEAWWARYWNTSLVEIGEPSIELQYYRSHYNMAALSRDPDFPPCDYGICTSDDPVCAADYKINYNYQAGFLGLNVAGRFDQTRPYDAPGLAQLPQAEADSETNFKHKGAYMSLGLGPRGMVAEHLWLGMKSQGAFYLVNTAERWYLTRDLDYARKVYPMVRSVCRFWEEDLKKENGNYLVIDDSAQEWTGHHCVNCCAGVAFIKSAMRLMLDLSEALGLDPGKRNLWRDIRDHVGPIPVREATSLHSLFDSPQIDLQNVYPKGTLEGKEVIVFEGEGIDWSFECAVQVFPIYPAGEIGLDSDTRLLQAARHTVALRSLAEAKGTSWPGPKPSGIDGGAWFDGNHGCLFFTAAVRIGHDPNEIWTNLLEWCQHRVWPNGLRRGINDGIENYSAVPNAIHEMMLLSHENVLRFFRVWPRQLAPDARFENLWAYGGFRVSAALVSGEVSEVRIESRLGRDCTIENPWPQQGLHVVRPNGAVQRLQGARVTLKTKPGEIFRLEPA